MNNGFIRVAAATPNIKVGDCEHNTSEICRIMEEVYAKGAQFVVFPELCITGYTCEDLFWQSSLIETAKLKLAEIVSFSKNLELIAIVGLPYLMDGKLYNVAAVVYNGEIMGMVPKSHIPNYSEFYEGRHFASGKEIENRYISLGIKDDCKPLPYHSGTIVYTVTLNDEEYDDEYDDEYDEYDSEYDCEWEDDDEFIFGRRVIFNCENIPNFKFAIEICEDLWVPNPPSTSMALAGATVIANLSASSETTGKDVYRKNLVAGQSARTVSAYVYADAGEGESSTDLVFAAHNMIAENGTILAEAQRFKNETVYADIDLDRIVAERQRMTTFESEQLMEGDDVVDIGLKPIELEIDRVIDKSPFVPANEMEREKRCEEILTIQTMGLKKRLEHTNCKCAVVGISGGLDSTLALLVTIRAFDMLGLDRKGILAITMPGFGTTDRTYTNAVTMIKTLGCDFKEVNISEAVEMHFKQIGHDINKHNVTYENAQARYRTYLLMDFANEYNGMVIGTGDMSELALGWATYNGDHMSMYGVNGGVPKTLVRHLVKYYADTCQDKELAGVLNDVLDTPVSPELLPPKDGKIAQKTEDLVGPYELHDFFMYYILRFGYTPEKIFFLAKKAFENEYDTETILKWLRTFYRRFFSQQFKRSCLPDGPKVGSVAVSPRGDLRMPSDACANDWLERLEYL